MRSESPAGRADRLALNGARTDADSALVVAAKSGDASAFGELYERYRDQVYRFCLARTGSAHDAEDLASDVFVKVLRSLPGYQDRGLPFVAFLFRVARNAAIDRSRGRKQPASFDELASEPVSGQSVERDAIFATERAILLAALARLKDTYREVLVLRFIEGYGAVEVAQLLGKSEGAVRILQHRAVAQLRVAFAAAEKEAARGAASR